MADINYSQHGIRGYFYNPQQIKELLSAAGLEIVLFYENVPRSILGPRAPRGI